MALENVGALRVRVALDQWLFILIHDRSVVAPCRSSLSGERLDIWDGRAVRLHEAYFRTDHQGAEAKIGEGEHDVEVFVHVAVMEQVMAIEEAEPAGFLDPASFGEVHAPMDVFVEAIISCEGSDGTKVDAPKAGGPAD